MQSDIARISLIEELFLDSIGNTVPKDKFESVTHALVNMATHPRLDDAIKNRAARKLCELIIGYQASITPHPAAM